MKKTLIASAVAAATLSSTAFAMDPASDLAERLDSMPEFYGNIQLVNVSAEGDDGDSNSSFGDNGSTLGIKHSHMITDGVEGFLKAEFEFDADDKEGNEGLSGFDEAYIGIKGDFGSIQFGSDDTVAEDFDVLDFEEVTGIGTGNLVAMDEGDNIQYRSPELVEGLTVGITHKLDQKPETAVGTALSVAYEADAFTAVLSYAMAKDEYASVDENDNPIVVDGEDAFGIGGTFSVEDLTLGLSYEDQDKASYIGLGATYVMGANQFALQYGMGDNGLSDAEEVTSDEIWVQALHNVSDNMYVYVEYLDTTTETGGDDADAEEFAIGAAYSF